MARKSLLMVFGIASAITAILLLYAFMSAGMPAADKTAPANIVSLKDIKPGSFVEIEWRNRPVIVFRPDEKIEAELKELNGFVHGPSYPFKDTKVFVYERVSTNRGCGAVYKTEKDGSNMEGVKWFGGWVDPCHFGVWDKAGRSYIRQPANDPSFQLRNFATPQWRYISDREIELL